MKPRRQTTERHDHADVLRQHQTRSVSHRDIISAAQILHLYTFCAVPKRRHVPTMAGWSVGRHAAVPLQVVVLALSAVLQRVRVLVHCVLVRAVRTVVVETANLVIGVGVRVCGRVQHVQFRLVICRLQHKLHREHASMASLSLAPDPREILVAWDLNGLDSCKNLTWGIYSALNTFVDEFPGYTSLVRRVTSLWYASERPWDGLAAVAQSFAAVTDILPPASGEIQSHSAFLPTWDWDYQSAKT